MRRELDEVDCRQKRTMEKILEIKAKMKIEKEKLQALKWHLEIEKQQYCELLAEVKRKERIKALQEEMMFKK